ncbi:MAG TPA: hypothetical protein VKV05_07905 [Terriglobales bacterium]|nr:hypothetical protein [Terriglobales bacterium]
MKFREMGMGVAGEEAGEGLALVVLAILALAGIEPMLLNSIAVIVAGIALAVEGAMLSARYAKALAKAAPQAVDARALSGGMSSSLVAGLAGIVLGILAILSIAPETLIGVALIAFGAAVLFDYMARVQIRALRMVGEGASGESARIAISAASSTNTAGVLIAAGLVTLGILVLAHAAPEILASAAFLGLGTYLVLEGASSSGLLTELAAE